MPPLKNEAVMTVGQVADLLGVASKTVVRWTDTGIMPSYRIPHGRDRRVLRADLVQFIREHQMLPTPRFRAIYGFPVLLAVGLPPDVEKALRDALERVEGASLQVVDTWFAAGELAASHFPAGVVIDSTAGRFEVIRFMRAVRNRELLFADTKVAILLNEDEADTNEFAGARVFQKPLNAAAVVKYLTGCKE